MNDTKKEELVIFTNESWENNYDDTKFVSVEAIIKRIDAIFEKSVKQYGHIDMFDELNKIKEELNK